MFEYIGNKKDIVRLANAPKDCFPDEKEFYNAEKIDLCFDDWKKGCITLEGDDLLITTPISEDHRQTLIFGIPTEFGLLNVVAKGGKLYQLEFPVNEARKVKNHIDKIIEIAIKQIFTKKIDDYNATIAQSDPSLLHNLIEKEITNTLDAMCRHKEFE